MRHLGEARQAGWHRKQVDEMDISCSTVLPGEEKCLAVMI